MSYVIQIGKNISANHHRYGSKELSKIHLVKSAQNLEKYKKNKILKSQRPKTKAHIETTNQQKTAKRNKSLEKQI